MDHQRAFPDITHMHATSLGSICPPLQLLTNTLQLLAISTHNCNAGAQRHQLVSSAAADARAAASDYSDAASEETWCKNGGIGGGHCKGWDRVKPGVQTRCFSSSSTPIASWEAMTCESALKGCTGNMGQSLDKQVLSCFLQLKPCRFGNQIIQ